MDLRKCERIVAKMARVDVGPLFWFDPKVNNR